jgi:hypothetical protein
MPWEVFLEFWPLFLVVVGLEGLVGWPGWTVELNSARPGFSWLLIASGLILLPFTSGLVDQRLIIIPGIIIAIGVLVLWRRSPKPLASSSSDTKDDLHGGRL